MEAGMNTSWRRVIYLLAHEVTTVTRRMSRQFNFSFHVKINNLEFEDKFLIKPTKT